MLTAARSHLTGCAPGELTDGRLAVRVYRQARCAKALIDPDQWFPVATDVVKAREQAAEAIAVCDACPVQADCLEFALRRAPDIGAHGVWGGLVEGERLAVRRRWLTGVSAAELLA